MAVASAWRKGWLTGRREESRTHKRRSRETWLAGGRADGCPERDAGTFFTLENVGGWGTLLHLGKITTDLASRGN